MFTHKIISKEFENGVLVLGVEFTDGVKTITEAVKPQDEAGLKYFLEQRLISLNSLNELEKVTVNSSIDLTKPVVVPEPNDAYLKARYELIELKQDVELGLATQAEYDVKLAKVIALKAPKVIK